MSTLRDSAHYHNSLYCSSRTPHDKWLQSAKCKPCDLAMSEPPSGAPPDPGGDGGDGAADGARQPEPAADQDMESGQIDENRPGPNNNVDGITAAMQNTNIASPGEAAMADRARLRDRASVPQPPRLRVGVTPHSRQDLPQPRQSVLRHAQISPSGRPVGRDRVVDAADNSLHLAEQQRQELIRLRARNEQLEALAAPRNQTATQGGSQPSAADLAAALKIILDDDPEMLARLRPSYAQAATVKHPTDLLRNFPDAEKFSGEGADADTVRQNLQQLVSTVRFRLSQCAEPEGLQVEACGMLCLKGQAFVTFRNALEVLRASAGPECTQDFRWAWFEKTLLKVYSIDPMSDYNRQQRLRDLDITSALFRAAANPVTALYMEYVAARGLGSPDRQLSAWAELCSFAGNLPKSLQHVAMLGPGGEQVTSLDEAVHARGAVILQRLRDTSAFAKRPVSAVQNAAQQPARNVRQKPAGTGLWCSRCQRGNHSDATCRVLAREAQQQPSSSGVSQGFQPVGRAPQPPLRNGGRGGRGPSRGGGFAGRGRGRGPNT